MDMFESSIVVRCLLYLCYCLRQNGQNGSWPDWKKSKRVTFGSSVRFFLDFNGYAIRTTRSIAGYLSNCKLFHCWAILCHDFSIDAGLDGWLALLCFWSVFVLPTCQLCSRCFDEGIDIFVCMCVFIRLTTATSNQFSAKNNIYVRLTDCIYLSIHYSRIRCKWRIIEIIQARSFAELKSKHPNVFPLSLSIIDDNDDDETLCHSMSKTSRTVRS